MNQGSFLVLLAQDWSRSRLRFPRMPHSLLLSLTLSLAHLSYPQQLVRFSLLGFPQRETVCLFTLPTHAHTMRMPRTRAQYCYSSDREVDCVF